MCWCLKMNDFAFKVSRTEIREWCDRIGDRNPIHKGKDAVVPGNLIASRVLSELEKSETIADFRFTFKHPATAGALLKCSSEQDLRAFNLIIKDSDNHLIARARINCI